MDKGNQLFVVAEAAVHRGFFPYGFADEPEDGQYLIKNDRRFRNVLTAIVGDDVVHCIFQDALAGLVQPQGVLFEAFVAHEGFRRVEQHFVRSEIFLGAEVTVGKLDIDKSGTFANVEPMMIIGRNREKIAFFIRDQIAVEPMHSTAFPDVDQFVIGMAVFGQMKNFLFEFVQLQAFELIEFAHIRYLQKCVAKIQLYRITRCYFCLPLKYIMKLKLLPLALGGLTIGITEFVVMGLLPDIALDLNITIPQAGHLIAAYALGVVVGAPLLVIAGRNLPPKKMLLILAFMLALFNATSIVAEGYELMIASRFLSGLPHGAFFGIGAVVASRLAEKGKEASSIAFMFSGLTFANVVGVPLGTYVGHHLHWRFTFVIIAIIGLITVLGVWKLMPSLEKEGSDNLKEQLGFFSKIEAWLLIFITAIGFGGLFAWISYIAPMLTNISRFTENQVPYLLVVAGLGMVAGNIAGGKISDKLGPSKAVLVTLLSVASVLTADYFLSDNKIMSIILVFLTGCAAFTVVAPINMLVIGTAKGAEMIGAAAIQASFNIGNALGAYLGGLPLLMGFGYESPNLVGVAMALTGAAISVIFLKRYGAEADAVESDGVPMH